VTYPDPAVVAAVTERFVPLRLDLFRDRAVVRPLNVIWTPTLLFADRRGTVHYESLNFLPPADFLDLLDVGEACVRQRWGEYDRAIALFAAVTERNPEAPFAAEALYRRGIAVYLKSHSNDAMYAVWQQLLDRFPESIWARRVP
jgi:hypothetical protein